MCVCMMRAFIPEEKIHAWSDLCACYLTGGAHPTRPQSRISIDAKMGFDVWCCSWIRSAEQLRKWSFTRELEWKEALASLLEGVNLRSASKSSQLAQGRKCGNLCHPTRIVSSLTIGVFLSQQHDTEQFGFFCRSHERILTSRYV